MARAEKYVDHTNDILNTACIIHGPGNSSDECKVLGDFGYKYDIIRPTKDRGNYLANKKKFNRQKQNNDIFNHAVDETLPQENNKVSAGQEAHENIESDIKDNDLFQIDNMGLDDKKEKTK